MGASGWDYVVAYQPDVRKAFSDLQQKVFDERDFADEEELAEVTTLEELVALKESEEFWEYGTHSILDMHEIIDAGRPDEEGAIRPVSPAEAEAMLGTQRPTRADFERMAANVDVSQHFPKWSGRCATLYLNGEPEAIGFWGWSGD